MNQIILIGRLTRNPEIKDGNTKVAKYSIAVDRKFKREGEPEADFFNCTAFGKTAEFGEKYLTKGKKILVRGELRNNDYTNKDGQKVRAVDIIVNEHEFVESKSSESTGSTPAVIDSDGYMELPDVSADELPFT